MGKLQLHYDKTLKLTNALIKIIDLSEIDDFQNSVIQLENYIKSKGYNPIGPLTQKTRTEIDENGELQVKIYLIRQSNNYINHVEPPYQIKSIIRVNDCMYVRYNGEERKLKFAYDKINNMVITIIGIAGTLAETYANDNGFTFIPLTTEEINSKDKSSSKDESSSDNTSSSDSDKTTDNENIVVGFIAVIGAVALVSSVTVVVIGKK